METTTDLKLPPNFENLTFPATTDEVASLWGLSGKSLRRWHKDIKYERIVTPGGHWRITKKGAEDIARYLSDLE